ncbi:TonB-dependent receptor [Chitinophaga defluvii]|uniref:TonB-dependent receptor n=1 Tax=Chitinophaga defluvii TaxID=3163343 RepID=A0ABV2T8N0_9BACT
MQKVVKVLDANGFIAHRKRFHLFLIMSIFLLFSQYVNAQDLSKKITVTIQDASIKEAFNKVKEQSGILFAFNADINKYAGKKVSIDRKDITVRQAIELIIAGTNLHFKKVDDQLLIEEKPAVKQQVSPNAAAGQGQGTGGLKGRIVEFETSQPLPGASVQILELNRGITTDSTGYYRFTGIRAGRYTLKVSFVSYATENQIVEVKANRDEVYDIKLQGNNQLGEVIVTATGKTRKPVAHASEKQVLQEIKAAQSVVSGISSQEISRSADRNVADVVKRISGVSVKDDKFIIVRGMNERYNLTYLNGNIAPSTEQYSRAFALDLLPTRIIDKILIYKSPAPDLMGDMTGGAVKIFTKDAKNVKHFDIELQSGFLQNTSFNKNFLTYTGGKYDFLGFDDGTRKLPSSVPGYGDFTRATISQKEYVKSFSNILTYGKKTALPPMQLTANYYNSFKVGGRPLSVLSSLSYKNESKKISVERMTGNLTLHGGTSLKNKGVDDQNTENAQLSLLQNFTYRLGDSTTIYFKNFVLQQGQTNTILKNREAELYYDINQQKWVMGGEGIKKRDIILSYNQRFLYSGNLGGNTSIGSKGKQKLDWNTGYTYSNLTTPDQRVIHLQQNDRTNIPVVGDPGQNWVPVWREQQQEEFMGNALEQGMISRVWIKNIESQYNGSVDYSYKWRPWATFKAGTYQQWKERKVFRRVFTVNEGDLNSLGQPVDFSYDAIGRRNPDMDMNLVIWRQQDLGQLWSDDYLRDDGTGLKVYDRTKGGDAYTATEQNNSAYLAASLLPMGTKLDIYGGVRVEYNRQKVAGALGTLGDIPGAVNTPVLADLKSTEILPSLNIGYRPSQPYVFRLSYGKTVNRPEFRELSPYQELDYNENQRIRGNSKLQLARIDNYDLRVEWYPKESGAGNESFSLGGFYKKIEHPIERVISKLNLDNGAANIQYMNADKADVYGIELDFRKYFNFIPGTFFRNLSFIGNASYIYSRAERTPVNNDGTNNLNDPVIRRQLQGQSPYTVNGGLYYENAGSGTKLGIILNQTGPRIYAAAIGRKAATTTGNYPDFGTQPSLIELARRQLDISATQRIGKGLQLKFSVQNLLNDAVRLAEDANFTYKYEKAQYIRSPTNAYFSGDLLASDYRPGRYFIITFTYSL